jgi:hypothetical protein
MSEVEYREKLRKIAQAMRRFETSAAQMKRMGLDHSYWTGREEAILDIRDEIGALDEFEKEESNAETPTMAGPAPAADSSEAAPATT